MIITLMSGFRLAGEMIVVGGLFCGSSLLITLIQSLREHGEWRTPGHIKGMLTGTLASGALLHLALEASGGNAWYAAQYTPLL